MASNQKADGSVIINTQMDTTDIDKSMDGLGKHTDKAEKKMQKLGDTVKKVGKAIVAAFAVQKVIQFAKETVKAAEVQEEMERKLETIMRQRMGATEDQIQSVKDLTAAQQALGVVGDEVQMSGAQQLATFLRTSDALKTLIPAMNNLAVQQNGVNVSAGAMQNIGNLMGKVMQGQTSALTRVGISFSKAEEKILKYGNEQQRAATLAQVITNNVGNMNEALANTPAGKIQQIKNNFGDMLEVLGMGIQNIITPFLDVINKIVLALQKAATAFRNLTQMITGVDANASPAISGTGEAADLTDALAEAEEKEAEAKKKQNKEQKRYLSGLDEIRRWESDKEDEDEEEEESPVPSTAPAVAKETTSALDGLLEKLKELADIFKAGFWDGLGDYVPRLKELKKDLATIKAALKDIWTDPAVLASMDNYARKAAYALGQIVGAAASIGLTIANLIVGGIADFLVQSKDRIKQHLIAMFDIGAEIWEMAGEFAKAIAYIFEAFGGQKAQEALGHVIGIFYEIGAFVAETALKIFRDLASFVWTPIIENAEKIKTAVSGVINVLEIVFDGLLIAVRTVVDAAREIYDKHISKLVTSIRGTITRIVGILTEGFNQNVLPVLTQLANRFKEIMEGPFGRLVNSVKRLIGILIDRINELWNGTISPLLEKIAGYVMPILGRIVDVVGNKLLDALEWLINKLTEFTDWCSEHQEIIEGITTVIASFFAAWTITGLIGKIAGFIKSLAGGVAFAKWAAGMFVSLLGEGGAFTLVKNALGGLVAALGGPLTIAIAAAIAGGILLYKNWDTVCEWAGKLKEKVTEVWNGIKTIISMVANAVVAKVSAMKESLAAKFNDIKVKASEKFNQLKENVGTIWASIKSTAVSKWDSIKSAISEKTSSIKSSLLTAWTTIKENLESKFTAIKTAVGQLGEKFQDVKDNYFTKVVDYLKNDFSSAFESIKKIGEDVVNYFKDTFLSNWSNAWGNIADKVSEKFSKIADFVKEPINDAIRKVNDAIDWINDKLGGIWDAIAIPEFTLGGGYFGPIPVPSYHFNGFGLRNISNPPQISHIPELAKGAVIPPNAPFMAMLGDQRQGTNIEAPLDTIKQAMRDVMGSKGNQYTVNAQVGARTILQIVIDEAKLMQMQTGRNPFETI